MRLDATVADSSGRAVEQLAEDLRLSKSQIVDEAVSLYLKVVMEVRRGRRLVMVDPRDSQPVCELATPTLTVLEWAQNPAALELPREALQRMHDLVRASKKPGERLRAAAKRHRR